MPGEGDIQARNFVCETCLRQFGRGEHLRRHLRTHTKEKPYICPCGKSFARRDLLTRHTRLTHSDEVSTSEASPCLSSRASTDAQEQRRPRQTPDGYQVDGVETSPELTTAASNIVAADGLNFDHFFDFTGFVDNMEFLDVDFFDLPRGDLYIGRPSDRSQQGLNEPSDGMGAEVEIAELKPIKCQYRMKDEWRKTLVDALDLCPGSDVTLPSSLALGRFLTGFFFDCQHHMPIIHVATFDLSTSCEQFPEFVLAAAAIGAIHRFQKKEANVLHQAALSLASAKIHRIAIDNDADLHYMQALVLLETYCLWEHITPVSVMPPNLQNLLLDCARYPNKPAVEQQDWASWAIREARTRTSIAAFCIISVRSIFHHTAPAVAANELASSLPCSAALWSAPCAATWEDSLTIEARALEFRGAYKLLMTGETDISVSSSFGCFALLQAIMQRIDLSRRMSLDGTLRSSEIAEIESALYRWKRIWNQGPESTLDPGSVKTSLTFQASSCLTLAYIRLSQLDRWIVKLPATDASVEEAAQRLLTTNTTCPRNAWNASSLIHSAHTLMTVVRIGLDYAKRILAFYWDPQHFLCWTESVVHLSKWLAVVAGTLASSPLNSSESSILTWIHRILTEADYPMSFDDAIFGHTRMDTSAAQNAVSVLGSGVVEVWCQVIPNSNNPWSASSRAGELIARYKQELGTG